MVGAAVLRSPPARITIWLLANFEVASATAPAASSSPSHYAWIESLGISWTVGVDGISLFLVVLTGILFPIAILGADPHHDSQAVLRLAPAARGRAAWASSCRSTSSCSS